MLKNVLAINSGNRYLTILQRNNLILVDSLKPFISITPYECVNVVLTICEFFLRKKYLICNSENSNKISRHDQIHIRRKANVNIITNFHDQCWKMISNRYFSNGYLAR